jgi:two-component system, sensor histidine kinase and response regulator
MKSAARQFFYLIARRAKLRSLLVLALLPGFGALALVAYISYQNGRAEFERSVLYSAQILMQAVDSEFSGDQLALRALATSSDLRENDLAGFYREATEFVRSAGTVNHIVLTDAAGQQILNTSLPYGASLPKTQNMERVQQVFTSGKPSISDLLKGTVSKQWSIILDVPVVRDGKVIYALGMVLKAERMQRILTSLHLDEQWSASIYDRKGTIVGRLRNPEDFVGRPGADMVLQMMREERNGVGEGMTADGLHVWGAIHRSPSTGYAVAVSLPYNRVQGALWQSVATASLAAIVLMMVCLAIAWRFAEQILSSVKEITKAAAEAEKGELNLTLDRKGPIEFIEMAEQFDRMLKALRTSDASQRKLSQAVEQSPESIVITDLNARIEYVNEAFLRITGYRRDEVIGQKPNIIASGRTAPTAYADLWRTLKRGDTWKGEFINRRKDGIEFVEFAVISPIRSDDGRITHYLGVKEDITEKSRLANELERHRHHLEDLVSERTHALALALQQAETANRAKSTFLSNMSHELRTPLNSVIGFARLMTKSERLNETERKNLEIISRAGNHLLTLINDVLELSKIEAGQVSVCDAATDVAALVREVADMLRPRAEQGDLSLEIRIEGVPDTLHCDTVKLRQILINLLSNAVKFTRQGGVTLTVRGAPAGRGSARLEFEIRDSGIGIDPADQQRIFEPFVQAVTHATSAGTGLGLPITQRYLRMMGSELTLESAPGAGSVFGFALTLPVVDAAPRTVAARGPVVGLSPADWGKCILVVEDNEDARLLVEQLLTPLGFAVVQAENGEVGVRKAAELSADLILMDWRMPKMDGLEAARRIRRLTLPKQPKILMLTASAFEEQKQSALATGIDDFVRKPFQEDELFDAIERHLEICFVRKGEEPAGEPAPETGASEGVTPEEVQALPAQQFERLKTAVEELNQNKLNAVLADIARTNPGLGLRLRAMARNFRYAELWAALGGASVNPIENA